MQQEAQQEAAEGEEGRSTQANTFLATTLFPATCPPLTLFPTFSITLKLLPSDGAFYAA